MAISGTFAGLAGRSTSSAGSSIATPDILVSNVGFLGIAVALLGRNSAVGVLLAALLFGALTSAPRAASSTRASSTLQLAGNLTLIIQGLVVLFVGADLLVLRSGARRRSSAITPRPGRMSAGPITPAADDRRSLLASAPSPLDRWDRPRLVAGCLALPPVDARTMIWSLRLLGILAVALRDLGGRARRVGAGLGRGRRRDLRDLLGSSRSSRASRTSTASSLGHAPRATLVYATPLTFGALGGLISERSGVVNIALEGMMLMGAFFGIWGARRPARGSLGLLIAMPRRGASAFIYGIFAIHFRADQIVGGTAVNFLAVGITGYLFIQIYGLGHPDPEAGRSGRPPGPAFPGPRHFLDR